MNLHKVSEIEISYKDKQRTSDRPKITKSQDAYEIFRSHWDDNKIDLVEQTKLLLLNRANRVLGVSNISSGGITETLIDPRLVFVTALKANATSIILAHNHPSANLFPSESDKSITRFLKQAGDLLYIKLLDHLIITRDGFYSIEEGMPYERIQKGDRVLYEVLPPF